MDEKSQRLRELLAEMYDLSYDPKDETQAARKDEFVFHMADCASDLRKLAALYDRPEDYSADEAREIVQRFLYHASGHVVAAARLYDAFLDPFGPDVEREAQR